MSTANTVVLYVKDPAASTAFYSKVLGKAAEESSPNFSLFELSGALRLGLWALHDVEPPPQATGGAAEIGFVEPTAPAVDACHLAWKSEGVSIAQAPVRMDFGYTFTAVDPDGHRLRVYCPGQEA